MELLNKNQMSRTQPPLVRVEELPALPEIYIKVTKLIDDISSTADQIGDIIQTDPSITIRILKLINSAYFGLTKPVTSITQTVTLLGNQRLKHILLGSVLERVFKDIDTDQFSMEAFWQHSIKTAIISRHLAMQNARIIDHDALFTAGLLHDIGRLVIVGTFADRLDEIEALKSDKNMGSAQAEREILGYDHTEVGEALLESWGLPYMLIQSVKNHHDIDHEGPFALASCIVYLSNQLSHNLPPQDEEEAQSILNQIQNWQQSKNTAEQVMIGWQLAEDQALSVMESFGMRG